MIVFFTPSSFTSNYRHGLKIDTFLGLPAERNNLRVVFPNQYGYHVAGRFILWYIIHYFHVDLPCC